MAATHYTHLRNPDDDDAEGQPLLDALNAGPDGHDAESPSINGVDRKQLERTLLRKLDRRNSILVLIYILNYIDRNNASAARLRGFEEDLGLKGNQFASILSVLYVGYILMQIPSNMFLNYFGKPSKYLPWCMAIWGGLSVCTGFATSYFAVLVIRFFLGFVEAAFFPGALFHLAKWYKRDELAQRTALLTCGILLSNAFGALIASVILDVMHGVLGFTAWRWLFFIEGTVTILVAFWSMFILPDFPENSSNWLTPAEQSLALQRMIEDAAGHGHSSSSSIARSMLPAIPSTIPGTPPSLQDELDSMDRDPDSDPKPTSLLKSYIGHWPGLYLALTDGKVWFLALTLTCMVVSLSFHAYFPTLSATLGYERTVTLLLCAPPWLFAVGVAVPLSRHSDKVGDICKHLAFSLFVGILGFMLAMSTMNTAVRYASLFLMAQSYGAYICFLAWASGSVSFPPAKRAVALALINCISQLGNVVGSYVWPSSWGPTYNTSYAICIFMSALTIALCLAFRIHLARLNTRAEKLEGERGMPKGYRYKL